ncbi:hypothetical protein NEMIN01_1691 [Nematocida minor]|uniref:uncharacterized protein n=1 Tax=Nematocida minor TaxID=1912983 RepID=UPI00221EC6E2|nr:uncharacterized protein NEMIN01_1691 [Nematocida minor]KAI5191836.1 hypothetical protein NEMIN01_1691 [Nematocida minor]
MLKRVLEDITNVRNNNIKVTIKREERPLRREILKPYLEYSEEYYRHLDRKIGDYAELLEKYAGEKNVKMYRENKEIKRDRDSKSVGVYTFNRHIIRGVCSGPYQYNVYTSQSMQSVKSVECLMEKNEKKENKNENSNEADGVSGSRGQNDSILSIPAEEIFRVNKIGVARKSETSLDEMPTKKVKQHRAENKELSQDEEVSAARVCASSPSTGEGESVSVSSDDKVEDSKSSDVEVENNRNIVDGSAECKKSENSRARITMKMRTTLLEWMYDVKVDYKLNSTTYQTAVRIVDKYFLANDVKKEKYQLIGAVCLFISNKLIECKSRGLMAYIDVCDGAYTKDEFLKCERDILMRLGGFLNFLLPMHLIKEDRFVLGNALCEYASEAVLLDASYACLTPKDLSAFIDTNVSACLSGEKPSETFVSLLTQSNGMLDQQLKQVKELVMRL